MPYRVKELYYTLQGEGRNAGRTAVFCRFAGCNLWSGREKDRALARCNFCDTDFVGTDGPGGGIFATADDLSAAILARWPGRVRKPTGKPLVVFTGGEPLLQLDAALVMASQKAGFEIAVETNGTLPCPPGVDWICVSPKAGTEVVLRSGHELKLVFPQPGAEPECFAGWDFECFFLQPMDGPDLAENIRAAVDYCLAHPQWRLSLQLHKQVGLP